MVAEQTPDGPKVLVIWRDTPGGPRRYEGFAATKEGKADGVEFARDRIAKMQAPDTSVPDLSLREMWRRYLDANESELRPKTLVNYTERWKKWETMWGPEFRANQTTMGMFDAFRRERTKTNAPNQVGAMIRVVKIVYGWADSRELLSRNITAKYKFKMGKEEKKLEPEEFRTEEWGKVLLALRKMGDRHWRSWAVTMIAGSLGARVTAILSLRWEDIDLRQGLVTWPAGTDKTGTEGTQPITWDAWSALLTALKRSNGPFVFWAERNPDRPMSYQSWHYAFREAETMAQVPHRERRAAHGFRKMAAGEVWDKTGDALLAMHWIRDKDPKRIREYLKKRDDRMGEVAKLLDEGNRHANATGTE